MRKKILLTLLISLFTVGLWAADVSVVERFSQVNQTSADASSSLPGDVCNWSASYTRHQQPNYSDANYGDFMTIGTTNMPSSWMSANAANKQGYIQTTDLEGGIKAVAFRWAQFGAEASNTLNLEVKAGNIVDDYQSNTLLTRDGGDGENKTTGGVEYSHDFENKSNCQLYITNKSVKGGSKACRILIGDITITPYLLYTQKKVVISPSQTGYINQGLIDNTESEGSITYSIHDKDAATQNVAEINPSNGTITPKAIGKAIVTATWSEGATTSYELIVANMVAETFNGVSQGSSSGLTGATWTGDVCKWSNKFARRGTNDVINSEQASWLTMDGTTRGFLRTTNLEGGLLGVSFDYAQFGAEGGKVLIWKTSDGADSNWVIRDGDLGANKNAPDAYSCIFENKENAQLEILNASIMDDGTQPTNNARLLIHNLKIVPYLLYATKEAALDTRIATTYTHPIINNTAIEPGTDVVYSISSMEGLEGFNPETGEVTATESTQGNYTITATWGDVSTSYELAITSRNETSASFDGDAIVNIGLSDEAPTKTLTYTAGYDGTAEDITYTSNNSEVATVANDGTVTKAGGVGQAIITAHLAQTTNYKAAEASYIIQVVDDGANIQVETFSAVTNGNAAAHTDQTWEGDLFEWYTTQNGGVRKNGDKFPSDNTTEHTGIWMGIPETTTTYATLQSKKAVEGGIKHLSFYWEQWGAESEHILNPVVYVKTGDSDPVQKASVEYMPTGSPVAANRMLIGINNIQSNSQVIIRNESHKSDGSRDNGKGRIILDEIHITPYLLYTNKSANLDTRNSLTYTNNELINNTTGDAVVYSIAPTGSGATIDAGSGEVTATDETEGDFVVTATWGEVTTTYSLHIISRTATTASYANADVRLGLGGTVPANVLTKTDGYDGTITYNSSNTAVATVANDGTVTLAGGVGQTTITATLPQTTNYKAASASYNLYVRDNGARIEMFSGVSQSGIVGETLTDWNGDLFTWQAQYQVRRGTNDTIHAGAAKHQGTSIGIQDPTGTPLSSILQSKGDVEGGIKYLSFYWAQWGAANGCTRRITVYAGDEKIGEQENPNGTEGRTGEEFLLGINNAMKSNKQLIIKNESYKGTKETLADNNCRIVLDNIYITPYLLYTTKEHTLDLRIATKYTHPIINNTESGSITYSLEDNDGEASINASTGEVTGIKAGQVTVKATWNEGAYTTYTLNILAKSVTEASYPKAVVRIGLNDAVDNTLDYTEGYDGTIAYASSNTAVADFEAGALVINGVGQTTITATLPETENYLAASASYNLYVRDNTNARIENFSNVETGHGVIGVKDTVWTGTYFDWIPTGAIRHNNSDTIWGSAEANRKIWIATSALSADPAVEAGVLASKEEIEGGIKYLSFYWKQWGSESGRTLRIAAFDGATRKGYMEYVPNGASTQEKFLLGVNDMMRNNHRLYIKNESFKTETFDGTIADDGSASKSRIIIDDIYITPYLLFTDKAERVMRIGETDKNESLINNTGDAAEFSSSDPNVASVAYDGTVTAKARGKVIITAKYQWSEDEFVTTTYPVTVWPVNCETFDGIIEQTSNYSNTTPRVGDKATWTTSLGGFNVGDFSALTTNLVRFRAPNNADEKAYIESSSIVGGIGSMTFDWNIGGAEGTTEWDIRILVNGREVKKLTNTEITATSAMMDHFEQITIDDINEPGNFTIRFENYSKIGGTYPTGNKARFLIDNITWTGYEGSKTLAENTNNEGWIRANGGQTRDVIISRSALVENVWNTLCLPFAISKSTDLDDAEVVEMTNVEMEGEVLNIYFSDITGDELTAGKPYLVKPASNKDISKTYANKQISMIASPVQIENVTMQGLFSPLEVTANDYNTLFVGTPDGAGNNLFYPQANGQLRGMRAYFKIGGAALSAPRRARYVINQKDVTTDIEAVMGDGLQVTGTQKILRDGQLFIIRDGKMYNAQGQVIK